MILNPKPNNRVGFVRSCKSWVVKSIQLWRQRILSPMSGERENNALNGIRKVLTPAKNQEPPECSSIFVEPMKWMQTVQEGFVGEKLQCMGCKARLGSFNWAGMQCNCGTWINPAFLLHKNKLDECHVSGQDVERGLSKHCLKLCLAWGNTFALNGFYARSL
ncbi:DUAL SPECIFICITY PROTEIN PHOSPHATASE 12 FAMILY MEMBER [Salix viminalis]|uniref:DUAL SPECIFICITY PROTEIN PHOSPHATASE 12 FAMILY MEMBER n=1 Tax=Salix viminalis TaxID=40686 RepID=A0A9Q0TAA9_SALVM|nr:DUAL SPECIFICITY PROTEIN PHOSPHATASE 12 FAMILY MEMBER [Salix viminalis]